MSDNKIYVPLYNIEPVGIDYAEGKSVHCEAELSRLSIEPRRGGQQIIIGIDNKKFLVDANVLHNAVVSMARIGREKL